MIWHDFHRFNYPLVFRRRLVEQLSQALLDFPDKDGPAVFRTPHEVHLKRENCSRVLKNLCHLQVLYIYKLYNQGNSAIPLPAKAGSPLAA
jgi:hypothetical protein